MVWKRRIGAAAVALGGVVPAILKAIFIKAPRKLWKEASKDINAAGASMILHSCMFTGSLLFLVVGVTSRRRTRFAKAVDLNRQLTWDPEGFSNKRAVLKWIMEKDLPAWVQASCAFPTRAALPSVIRFSWLLHMYGLQFPDWERAPFLQALLTSLWPGINTELSEWVSLSIGARRPCRVRHVPLSYLSSLANKMTAACRIIRKMLEGILPPMNVGKVEVRRINLGEKPITIYGVRMIPRRKQQNPAEVQGLRESSGNSLYRCCRTVVLAYTRSLCTHENALMRMHS